LTLLLDAGVWVAGGSVDAPYQAESTAILRDAPSLAALDLTLYEVANTVAFRFRQPRDAERLCRLIVRCCEEPRLQRVEAELVGAAADIAAEHGITAYDAAYVAAARRNNWMLVSTDIRDLVSKGLAVAPDAAGYP
jgi:predicted nucleic acid-binding protein